MTRVPTSNPKMLDESTAMHFSIIVCTYNRAEILSVCIETLANLDYPPEDFEIIIVDNNSSDQTSALSNRIVSRSKNVRYVFEPTQGLSHARNCGWHSARGSYVAYVDDECKVPPDWLTNAKTVIDALSPAALGGPYDPWYAGKKPAWFKDSYARMRSKRDVPHNLGPGEYLSGGNLIVRRDLLVELGGFDPKLGMKGNRIAYGEDPAFQNLVRQKYPDGLIFYDPSLLLYHMVRPEKMRLGRLLRERFARGRDAVRLTEPYDGPFRTRLRLSLNVLQLLGQEVSLFAWHSTVGVILRDRTYYRYSRNYLYEVAFKHAQRIGRHTANLFRLISSNSR